ncbi:MAG: murein biosynthesis integral membrane protein MurJ [Sphaerochaeta sp.]
MSDSTEQNKHSKIVMICTLASRLLGIVRSRVLATIFGATGVGDVINFTFNIPNSFRKLFAEGALNSALIPSFSQLLAENKKQEAQKLFGLLITYQTLLFLPVTILSYFYGPRLIAFLSDFNTDQISLAANLLPFFIAYLATISLSATFSGLLQLHKQFFHAFFSPLFYSIVVITVVLTTSSTLGPMSVAYATIGGGALQAAYAYITLRTQGYRLIPTFNPKGTIFGPTMNAWGLVSIGMGMQIITQMVSYYLASTLGEGSVTAFANSLIFYQTPYGINFNAIAAVSLPALSLAFAQGDDNQLKDHTRTSLVKLTSLLLPSTIIIFAFRIEIVTVILQGGKFTHADSLQTARVLGPYLLFMTTTAYYSLLLRLGFATKRFWAMTIIQIIQNLIDIVLMIILINLDVGIQALSIANGVSYLLSLIPLTIALKEDYQPITDTKLYNQIGKIILANIPILIAMIIYKLLAPVWYQDGSTLKNLLLLITLGGASILIWLYSYKLNKIEFFDLFRRKNS